MSANYVQFLCQFRRQIAPFTPLSKLFFNHKGHLISYPYDLFNSIRLVEGLQWSYSGKLNSASSCSTTKTSKTLHLQSFFVKMPATPKVAGRLETTLLCQAYWLLGPLILSQINHGQNLLPSYFLRLAYKGKDWCY